MLGTLFFDKQDRELLRMINETIDHGPSQDLEHKVFDANLHPHGILELTTTHEYRMAHAVINLLGNLESGGAPDRLMALRILRDEVLHSARTPFRYNTGRVLIQIMKEIIRSRQDELTQLKLVHDFRKVTSGNPRLVRQFLNTYHLLEMPEEWNQLTVDHHVHDANTKGRKNATHLIMDAWIKGIRYITVVYYNYVEPAAARELLQAAEITVYNSRMFCTRWNGLEKGSIFDDALDDKEYEGNLIYLLNSGSEFIRNNSKVRFVKKAQYRVDKPDYAERAVTEALVNALIHRDYIVLGSEIHIDMFDDRVEITSPGGMFGGGSIQEYDIYSIRSMRRNPVIADLFHRMKYMERRGSGLRKIVSETEKLPGYTEAYKPEFSSTATDFRVILKNVNYIMCGASAHDTAHDAAHDTSVISKQNLLLEFCADPKSRDEMQAYIDVSSRSHFSKYYLKPLLSSGKLEMMFPDKPKSKNQKYTTVHSK